MEEQGGAPLASRETWPNYMSEKGLKVVEEQAAAVKSCRGEIEATKLAVWQLKAEFAELQSRLSFYSTRLYDSESLYLQLTLSLNKATRTLAETAGTFSKQHGCALTTAGPSSPYSL